MEQQAIRDILSDISKTTNQYRFNFNDQGTIHRIKVDVKSILNKCINFSDEIDVMVYPTTKYI